MLFKNIHLDFSKVAFFLLIICAVTYAPGLNNAFNIDASIYLSGERVDLFQTFSDYFTVTTTRHYIPFNNLLNVNLFELLQGSPPFPYRLFNFVLFYLNGLLLYFFIFLLCKNHGIAFLTATLFCLHPVNAELLNHITLNIVFVMTLFLQLSLVHYWLYLGGKRKGLNYSISIIAFVFAMLSQELAVLFPLYLISMLYILKKYSLKNAVKHSLPFWGVVCVFFVLWSKLAAPQAELGGRIADLNLTVGVFVATLFQLVVWYVRNLFVPDTIVFIYNLAPAQTHIFLWNVALLSLIALLFTLFNYWKKNLKTFALIWFLIGFIVVIPASLAHSYMGLVIEPYWFYFSNMGFFFFVSLLINELKSPFGRKLKFGLIVLIFSYFVLMTQVYIQIGKTGMTRSLHWVKSAPTNTIALMDLAEAYTKAKNYDLAVHYFKKAIRSSRDDTANKAYFNIGVILAEEGHLDQAKLYLRKSISINPGLPHPYNTLGTIAVKEDRFEHGLI